MKKIASIFSLIALGLCLATTTVSAADAKTYQVTGPVLEVHDTYIVVQKGTAQWQITCDKATLGTIKVGDKVSIQYVMIAKVVAKK